MGATRSSADVVSRHTGAFRRAGRSLSRAMRAHRARCWRRSSSLAEGGVERVVPVTLRARALAAAVHHRGAWPRSPGAASGAVSVMCPGFAADCLETLEEIGMENRDAFLAAGGEHYQYIAALNARADHVAALRAVVRASRGATGDDAPGRPHALAESLSCHERRELVRGAVVPAAAVRLSLADPASTIDDGGQCAFQGHGAQAVPSHDLRGRAGGRLRRRPCSRWRPTIYSCAGCS